MSTLKKIVLGVVCVLALATFIFGGDVWSYLTTATSGIQDAARSKVPVQFEIERAKGMVEDLVPEIRKNMTTISREEVALNRLENQIAALEGRLEESKGEILTLKTDLTDKPDNNQFSYCGRTYTRSQVETDLAARFERHQVDEATLASLQQMRDIRQTSLEAAKKKLNSYLAQKQKLSLEIEQLQARLKMVELAKTTSDFNFDNDGLSDAKQLVDELRSRLEVEERLVGQSSEMANEVILSDEDVDNTPITQKVTQYFQSEDTSIKLASNSEKSEK